MSNQWKDLTREELLDEIKKGGRMVRYSYCFSIIIMSFKRTSEPHFVRAGRSAVLEGLPWTALALIVGWWGIPWGPIFTVQCTVRNMRGGHDITDDFEGYSVANRWEAKMNKHLSSIGLFLLFTFIATSDAFAANMEESAYTWLSAIFTVAGFGWVWTRTFRAADTYDIWYGTNRRDRIANTYDNEFGSKIHYGKCRVAIPKGHIFGSIGSSRFRRWLQRLFSGTDDRLRVQKLFPYLPADFEKSIASRLSRFDSNEKAVLIFIHGYNVTFSDAAVRAAQIGFDLKVPGVMALYSWPSSGEVGAYLSDADSVAASEHFLVEFIERVSRAAGTAKMNIIAHSMGNLGLIRALTSNLAQLRLSHIKFGQIFLAAPDIDVKLFKQLAIVYPQCSEKTTIYISAADHALSLSEWVHRNQRTGYTPPVTVIGGIDTVEATNIDVGLIGHGYYAAASALLYDIAILLRSNLPPEKRPGLSSAISDDGQKYWVMRAQLH